jgi:hypothetical protein
MSAYRIETVYGSRTLRIFHLDYLPRAVACICPREDGAVDLVPILYEGRPDPIPDAEKPFGTMAQALEYLGISEMADA